jgi:hypothetical protein
VGTGPQLVLVAPRAHDVAHMPHSHCGGALARRFGEPRIWRVGAPRPIPFSAFAEIHADALVAVNHGQMKGADSR